MRGGADAQRTRRRGSENKLDRGRRADPALDAELATVEAALEDFLLRIPNPADPDVPVGGEEANVTVREWGEQLPRVQPLTGEVGADAPAGGGTWERRPHWDVGDRLGIFESSSGAPRSPAPGSRSTGGVGSILQRSLISWFLDVHGRENGFTEIWPPAVVNAASARGTGQIRKIVVFASADTFLRLRGQSQHYDPATFKPSHCGGTRRGSSRWRA